EQLKLNLAKAQQQVDDVRAKRAKELLEVQKAELAVQEARQRISKTSASSIEYKEAELAVRQAKQSLAEIRERVGDLRKESAHAAQVGVAGDDQVVSARRRVQEATRSVREAETNLQRARSDGAKDVRRAQEQLARAQQQGLGLRKMPHAASLTPSVHCKRLTASPGRLARRRPPRSRTRWT